MTAFESEDALTAHVYLDETTRLSLTQEVVAPLEDVLPEYPSEDGEWCALTPDYPDHGSYIWLFAEHIAGDFLMRLHGFAN